MAIPHVLYLWAVPCILRRAEDRLCIHFALRWAEVGSLSRIFRPATTAGPRWMKISCSMRLVINVAGKHDERSDSAALHLLLKDGILIIYYGVIMAAHLLIALTAAHKSSVSAKNFLPFLKFCPHDVRFVLVFAVIYRNAGDGSLLICDPHWMMTKPMLPGERWPYPYDFGVGVGAHLCSEADARSSHRCCIGCRPRNPCAFAPDYPYLGQWHTIVIF